MTWNFNFREKAKQIKGNRYGIGPKKLCKWQEKAINLILNPPMPMKYGGILLENIVPQNQERLRPVRNSNKYYAINVRDQYIFSLFSAIDKYNNSQDEKTIIPAQIRLAFKHRNKEYKTRRPGFIVLERNKK